MKFKYKNLNNINQSTVFKYKISKILTRIRHKAILSSLLGTGLSFLHVDQVEAFPAYLDVTTLNGVNGFSINGKIDGHRLGLSVSKAGDINADGFDDVIVATKFADEAYVVYGKSSGFPKNFEVANLNGVNGFTIKVTGEQYLKVGGGGDINDDGIDDIIVGSPVLDNSGTGKAYVIFGNNNPALPATLDVSSLNGANGFILEGWTSGSWFGYSVAIVKDINGDGLDDIVVGAPYDFGTESGGPGDLDGRAYVILGKNNFPASLSVGNLAGYGFSFAVPENPNSQQGTFSMRLGWSVSGTGDVNGDGFNDVLVGAPRQHSLTDIGYGTDFAGITYVLFGQANLPEATIQSALITGITEQDEMGRCVSEAGDVNGDGIDDLGICSPLATWDNAFIDGQSFILHGHTNFVDIQLSIQGIPGVPNYPDLTNGVLIIPGNYSSRSISSVGDINGDGFSDVIIGDGHIGGTPDCSVALGSPLPYPDYLTQLSWQIDMVQTGRGFDIGSDGSFGWTVSEAGDVNGDGLDDMIIGSPEADTPTKSKGGRAYVIFGRVDQIGDVDDDGSVDLILVNQKNLVYAALMTNGYYTGLKQDLVVLPAKDERVVAVNDFNLDGVTDLATQTGTLVQFRNGPTYGVISSLKLPPNYHVIGSGNIRGKEVKVKKGYPELIIVKSDVPPIGKDYYYSLNQGSNWVFDAPQFLYSHNGYYPIVGAGQFIDSKDQTNRYNEVMMYSYFANGTNKDLIARQVSFTPQDQTKFLMTMYQDEVLGAGNFKVGNTYDEFIWSNSNNVYFSKWFSGYKLNSGEKVVGPK